MKLWWQCLFSKQFYKIYRSSASYDQYKPLEKWGNQVISTVNMLLNIALYASPFLCTYFYKRGFTVKEARAIAQAITSVGCILALSLILRAYRRSSNPEYVSFMSVQSNAMATDDKKLCITAINKYDFQFNPLLAKSKVLSKPSFSWYDQHLFNGSASQDFPLYQRIAIQVLVFVAIHTVSPQHIYSRLMAIIQSMLSRSIFRVWTRLVTKFSGQSAELRTVDGNEINTMFIDQRKNGSGGKNLIICCEGNTGFYEFSIMITPAKAGYSVLGWNHSGFIHSTSIPHPSQEQHAMEVVMLFAIEELGFKPEQIVMFGWSIGGYAATWAAVNFPVKGLILDAVFDDVVPLVKMHVPSSWSPVVKEVVRSYLDLNIGALITQYNGPVQLVRRIKDEITCFRPSVLSSNRGNYLLRKTLEHRHPDIMNRPLARSALMKILSLPQRFWATQVEVLIASLISEYMRDVNLTYFTPLPKRSFVEIMDRIK